MPPAPLSWYSMTNVTYTLVSGLPDVDTHPKSAKDGCIYTDPSGDKFAFEVGNLPVECKDENNASG